MISIEIVLKNDPRTADGTHTHTALSTNPHTRDSHEISFIPREGRAMRIGTWHFVYILTYERMGEVRRVSVLCVWNDETMINSSSVCG